MKRVLLRFRDGVAEEGRVDVPPKPLDVPRIGVGVEWGGREMGSLEPESVEVRVLETERIDFVGRSFGRKEAKKGDKGAKTVANGVRFTVVGHDHPCGPGDGVLQI